MPAQFCTTLTEQELHDKIELAKTFGELHLPCAELTELPPSVWELSELRLLVLDRNQLSVLPPEVGHLTNLRSLSMISNNLTTLPPEIGQLQYLHTINLSNNQLTALPPEIGEMHNLSVLFLSNNNLTALPPEFAQLDNLSSLMLTNNNLHTLPLMRVEQRLFVSDNPLPDAFLSMNAFEQTAFLSEPMPTLPPALLVLVMVAVCIAVLRWWLRIALSSRY